MRQHILTLLLSLAVLVTAGCGFHLRSNTQMQTKLHTLYLESYDPFGPLTRAVREQLRLNGSNVVPYDAARHDIPTLRIVTSSLGQDTVSIFQDGKTAEYRLTLSVQAQALLPGDDLYPISVTVSRAFFDNPLTALAKNSEQNIILQEMHQQAAQQILLKLLSVSMQPQDLTPTANASQQAGSTVDLNTP
ncbi:LPS assembly lipoprotein LptE [Serratia microhaemolytica]|uniref:LPS assembly lipoprotein LptE n=1 Tax=Serratia microhaemolytica TaxID=2675110 RepID=UPI000FDD89DF|nr:LPS assembly lipoprotein LptE [Serratia microhaemolytica]